MLVFFSTFNGISQPLLAFIKNKEQNLNKKWNELFSRPYFSIQRYVFLLRSGLEVKEMEISRYEPRFYFTSHVFNTFFKFRIN